MTEERRAKISVALTGRPFSIEHRANISAALNRPEIRAKISASHMGHNVPQETRAKQSEAAKKQPKGCASPNWKGGSTPEKRSGYHYKANTKRRSLGRIPLNSWFLGSDGHHLDIDHVVYIPHTLHQSVSHDHNTGRNMDKINALAMQWVERNDEIAGS